MRARRFTFTFPGAGRAAALTLALACAAATVSAQRPDGAAPAAASPTQEALIAELEATRAALDGDASLPPDVKARVTELYTRAVAERRAALELAARKAATEQRVQQAPALIEKLRKRLDAPAQKLPEKSFAGVPLDELAARARERQQQLEVAREDLKAAEKRLATLTALGPALSDEIASRREALRELRASTGTAPPEELPAAKAAREAYVAARALRLEAEIAHAEMQLANYEPLVRVATLERDAAAREVPRLDAEREALEGALELRRAEQARVARQDALDTEAAAADLPDAIASLAVENAQLRKELETVTLDTSGIAERLRVAERRVSELESDLVSIREQVESAGASEAVGRLLRRRLRTLRGVETDRLQAFTRANEIVRATDRRIDLGEQRRELADIRAPVEAIMTKVPAEVLARSDAATLRARAEELIAAKRATIEDLHEAYGRYVTQLASFDAVERQLSSIADAMRQFIRRELLWIVSLPPLSPFDVKALPAALAPLLDAGNWRRALADARAGVSQRPGTALLGLLAVLLLLVGRPWARRRLAALGDMTSRIRTDAFRYTLGALVLTALIAAAVPLILAYAGWLLRFADDAAPFSRYLSVTLRELASLFVIFSSARWLIHFNGLARRHFRWPEHVRIMLRGQLRWFTAVAMVCVVFGVYGFVQGSPESRLALGRPALIVFAGALAVFFWRVFGRRGPLMEAAGRKTPDSPLVRLWPVWYPLLVGVPVANVIAAAAGYLDAAATATSLLIDSGWLLLGVLVFRDTMLRWFTISERRLRFERAVKQRDEARAERVRSGAAAGDEPSSDVAEVEMPEVEEPEVDYQQLGEQGRAVVQVAVGVGVVLTLWAIWSDLLPALTVLDRIDLPMSRLVVVDGVEQRVAVNVTDVLVALLVVGGTFFAARNLSGLLGFTFLRRVARDAGAQYALVTLCQYALVATGLLYAFGAIGVEWSKLQWLVAALGVGLGFGLQEIVANFVSGIILLLERPVRVGDVVTVGDATGRVARIRIRATTIVDWDRKELVVPNKEFVTGRLLNWTLSNDVLRLVVPVGIAYGSDPRRARELLLESAAENEHVLQDPAPIVLFNSFGDNALGLELRVYLPSIEHLLTVQTALHDAIYEKLEHAGIVIAFPQRDVHLDTSAPLDIRVHRDGDGGTRRPWRRRRS